MGTLGHYRRQRRLQRQQFGNVRLNRDADVGGAIHALSAAPIPVMTRDAFGKGWITPRRQRIAPPFGSGAPGTATGLVASPGISVD